MGRGRGIAAALRGVRWEEEGRTVPWASSGVRLVLSALGLHPALEGRGRGEAAETDDVPPLVLRSWRGATCRCDAEDYARYVQLTGLSAFRHTEGFRGGWLLRRVEGETAEFLVLSLWDSPEAVRRFAGPDPERAVFYPEDERFLVERDERVVHWEVLRRA